jgi:uncharacterized spore protein YtfJ
MSDIEKVVEQIMKQIESSNVKAIIGEPYEFEGQAVIPVGKIGYGWGGGGGKTEVENKEEQEEENKGMGFGMGASVTPVGFIKITHDNVMFQPIMDIAPICKIWSIFGGLSLLMVIKFIMMSKIIKVKKLKCQKK